VIGNAEDEEEATISEDISNIPENDGEDR